MKNSILYFFLLISFFSLKGQELVKPNIVFIYADDLGWQDTQLNDVGAVVPWETPNMLSLAESGANFSQAYASAPTCAPSRGGTMSGRMPLKTKMTHVAGGQIPNVKSSNKTIESYYPGRLQLDEVTMAEALSPLGYVSGHVGKWHMAANHNIYPEAVDQGFDYQDTDRGITRSMGDRSVDFATDAEDDPYRLDADGRPYDAVTELALDFMDDNKEEPFFLYMAHWLVHSPIQTRDLALLEYYCNKLGIPVPTTDANITTPGQTNPYYGAMIASLDWSLGRVVDYLKETDDPRNPGKKLFETTYIIFASDNGGAENHGSEIITDNFPLDLGKTHTKEGGLRTPFVITGPGIVENKVYDNIVSHLDFYPTIMEVTGADAVLDANVLNNLDGVSLFPFLSGTETEIKNSDDTERTDLFWHYPHGQDERASSAIRSGNYKLYKIYDKGGYYKAFKLYNDDGSDNDIEEIYDVIDTMYASLKNEIILKLETLLSENDVRIPQFNPDYNGDPLDNQDIVPSVVSTVFDQDTGVATATLTANAGDAIIETAYLLYRIEEADSKEIEWFEISATINGNVITAEVPEVATGVIFTLTDENNFMVLSEELSIFNPHKITLANSIGEQPFKVVDEYAELIGNTTIGGTAYLQARTVEGGDGAKFYVKAPADVASITCDKITLGIISQAGDTVNVDLIIDGETQSFTYTSTNNNTPELFEFDTPVTFTQSAKEIQVITTSLSNSEGLAPRVRFVDLFFNVLGVTEPLHEITLNSSDLEQTFTAVDNYSELIGGTAAGSGIYLQMRTEIDPADNLEGDGAKFLVKSTEGYQSILNKVTFAAKSQKNDIVDVAITINGETQQQATYTSGGNNEGNNFEFVFNTPLTLADDETTEIKFVTTGLSNSGAEVVGRLRLQDIIFHVSDFVLGVDDIGKETNNVLNLYPNPVKNTFSLTKEVASGILYNVYGAIAYKFENANKGIDISNLKSGVYLLKVICKDGNRKHIKLLKE
ncbi:sulfatase-like hydrolase/transferase [Polaribacter sp. AHE13PA]|uniref:sulfatase-like hydrolase/transferase n=1 Tax=Polaribacter sp. AHE13PA TaxID=2745562 RepID=UPI001C4F78D2|nr:sulfatase-like hydrolase/transferase [Polaribacter sp. AHE13PA]QXP65539.1 sulfatase-like hydrolase/transferase [Polaribacter sp. AHE13PA]